MNQTYYKFNPGYNLANRTPPKISVRLPWLIIVTPKPLWLMHLLKINSKFEINNHT